MIPPVLGSTGWDAFRNTLLDEGEELWLWEVLGDTANFFPDASFEERLRLAEQFIRQLQAEELAYIVDGETGRKLGEADAEAVIADGRWRAFPPATHNDARLIPTPKWEALSKAARRTG